MERKTLILAVFEKEEGLKRAVEHLFEAAITRHDISLVLNDRKRTERLVQDLNVVAPATAAAALSNRGALGPLALLAGLGAVFSPIGAAVAGSPIGSELQGGDSLNHHEVVAHSLIAMGVDDKRAQAYATRVSQGDALLVVLSVSCDNEKKVAAALREGGAALISFVNEPAEPERR